MPATSHAWGLLLLRAGLGITMLWFGFSQIFDAVTWVTWVPEWAVNVLHIPPAMIVLLNGAFEVIAGAFLVLNFWTRWVALVLALHLALIVYEIGITAIGVRDFGLMAALLGLFFLDETRERLPSQL